MKCTLLLFAVRPGEGSAGTSATPVQAPMHTYRYGHGQAAAVRLQFRLCWRLKFQPYTMQKMPLLEIKLLREKDAISLENWALGQIEPYFSCSYNFLLWCAHYLHDHYLDSPCHPKPSSYGARVMSKLVNILLQVFQLGAFVKVCS